MLILLTAVDYMAINLELAYLHAIYHMIYNIRIEVPTTGPGTRKILKPILMGPFRHENLSDGEDMKLILTAFLGMRTMECSTNSMPTYERGQRQCVRPSLPPPNTHTHTHTHKKKKKV